MSNYSYSGVTFSGQRVEGETEARDEQALRARLQAEGIVLLEVSQKVTEQSSSSRQLPGQRKELTSFTRQLATMLAAGVRIDSIFKVLIKQAHSRRWRKSLSEIASQLAAGQELSQALSAHPQVFDGFYVSLIRAGESSGTLPVVLERLAYFLENSRKVNQKVKSALVYPLVIFAVAFIVLLILLVYIVPVFTEMFANLHAELPRLTQVIIRISNFVRGNFALLTLLLLAVALAVWQGRRLAIVRTLSGAIPLRVPILRNLVLKNQLATFCRTMETLLFGGVALDEAIPLAAGATSNPQLRNALLDGRDVIRRGAPLYSAWEDNPLVPPMMVEMVNIGEETGRLSFMFGKLAQFYSEEVEAITPALTSILEPILIVVMGLIVAAILISMYLPLFELISHLG